MNSCEGPAVRRFPQAGPVPSQGLPAVDRAGRRRGAVRCGARSRSPEVRKRSGAGRRLRGKKSVMQSTLRASRAARSALPTRPGRAPCAAVSAGYRLAPAPRSAGVFWGQWLKKPDQTQTPHRSGGDTATKNRFQHRWTWSRSSPRPRSYRVLKRRLRGFPRGQRPGRAPPAPLVRATRCGQVEAVTRDPGKGKGREKRN